MDLHVIVEADGAADPNPGPAACAAIVRHGQHGGVLEQRAHPIKHATNNEAEYLGLILGLKLATELRATHVEVRLDSNLVVQQVTGAWKVKTDHLVPYVTAARELAAPFKQFTLLWVPREQNAWADALAAKAMGRVPRRHRDR